MDYVARILAGKKAAYAELAVIANSLAALTGVDLTDPLMLVLDSAFGLLLVIQGILDFKWGSSSDKTGSKAKS